MKEKALYSDSEVSALKKLIIHRPDVGIEKVTPSRAVQLLYEDIVFLPKMQQEHDVFTEAISWFIGKENIFDVQSLLSDVLKQEEVRYMLVHSVCMKEKCTERLEDFLKETDPLVLANALISGVFYHKKKIPVFYPLPNLIFTRDIGIMVRDKLLISHFAKEARTRESILCEAIFRHHPLFESLSKNEGIINLGNAPAFEGGDFTMLSPNHLLIGSSERTYPQSIELIIKKLFESNGIDKVSVAELPKLRYCMHLDTVFTQLSQNEYVAYAPLVQEEGKMPVNTYIKGEREPYTYPSLAKAVWQEKPAAEFIACGEGIFPHDEREQWTDGCNLFCISDGVAFAYDRNIRTNAAFEKRGYQIVKAEELIQQFQNGLKPEQVDKTIITIPSSELSRARGGPHCLTLPILRG